MRTDTSRPRRPRTWSIALLLFAVTPAVPVFAGEDLCPDGICQSFEDCHTCRQDCGPCPSDAIYICYDDQVTKKTPKFMPQTSVEIHDAYNDLFFSVTQPREICNPRSEQEMLQLFDGATHLNRYQITLPKKTTQVLPKLVTVDDQFGTITIDAITGDKLMVPAAKSLSGPPPALEVVTADHYKCYDVRPSKGVKFPKGLQVTLADEFTGIPVVWDVIRPAHLCPVAQKNGEPVLDPCAVLMCYDVKRAKGQPKFTKVTPVYTADQFGRLVLDAVDKDDVCVPAKIEDGESGRKCISVSTSSSSTSTTSSTVTSTTSTVTSTTSSTTVPACGSALAPACNGTCPSGFTCALNLPVDGVLPNIVGCACVANTTTSTSMTTTSTTSTTSTTEAMANLSVSKSANPTAISSPGTPVTFTVMVTNHGPQDATDVEVTDVLPSPFVFSSSSATQGAYDDGTGVWSVGALAAGSTASLDIHATPSSCNFGTSAQNTAELTASTPTDSDDSDNMDMASVFFGCD